MERRKENTKILKWERLLVLNKESYLQKYNFPLEIFKIKQIKPLKIWKVEVKQYQ